MEARNIKISRLILLMVTAALPLLFVACSNSTGSSSSSSGGQTQNGTVALVMQDASTEDWAMIGVKILSIFTPCVSPCASCGVTAPSRMKAYVSIFGKVTSIMKNRARN